jgi:hypothetical protein
VRGAASAVRPARPATGELGQGLVHFVLAQVEALGEELHELLAEVLRAEVGAGAHLPQRPYLVKPFDVGELKARLRALLRRSAQAGEDLEAPSVERLQLDPAFNGVRVGQRLVELTRTEYELPELLMLNARVLPHSVIYERVWGYDFGPASNALRVYIGYLRRKLAEDRSGSARSATEPTTAFRPRGRRRPLAGPRATCSSSFPTGGCCDGPARPGSYQCRRARVR